MRLHVVLCFVLPAKWHYPSFANTSWMHGCVSPFCNHQDFCLITVLIFKNPSRNLDVLISNRKSSGTLSSVGTTYILDIFSSIFS